MDIYIDRYIDKNDFVFILAQTWAWLNNDHWEYDSTARVSKAFNIHL